MSALATVFTAALGPVLDKVFPDSAERMKAEAELAGALGDLDARMAEAGSNVMVADAQSPSWLPRNARPLVSLVGLAAVVSLVIVSLADPARGQAAADALASLPAMLWVTVLGPIGLWFPLRSIEKFRGRTR